MDNGRRAARGGAVWADAVRRFPDAYEEVPGDIATGVGDVIADLLHYVESLEVDSERPAALNGEWIADRALRHFISERDEAEQDGE